MQALVGRSLAAARIAERVLAYHLEYSLLPNGLLITLWATHKSTRILLEVRGCRLVAFTGLSRSEGASIQLEDLRPTRLHQSNIVFF